MTTRLKTIVAAAGLLALALIVWWWSRPTGPTNVLDLVELLPRAEKRSTSDPPPSAFSVETVTIDGQTKKAVVAKTTARLIYTLTVPPDGWLEVSFGMRPDTWDLPGDGAQFRVGLSEGKTYEELLRQYVNPKRGDRRWFTARLDLSAYEGRQVNVILNADAGAEGSADMANDFAVWGEPRIFSQR
jgi:hypothetical protein